MTVLVTGANGFIGSAVVRRVLAAGHTVRALVRPSSDRRNLQGLDVELTVGDITQADSMVRAMAGCRGVFHVAADYRLWVPRPDPLYRTNVEGTRNVLRAAIRAGVERMVYTSSVATLGLHDDDSPADESTPVHLRDMVGHYKRSKFLAEELVRQAQDRIAVVIVNPAAPVGPRDIRPTPTGRMILDAACGRIPAYVDTGLSIVHVDDVAEAHLLAYERGAPGRRYIAGGTNMSLREILVQVASVAGRRAPRVRLPHALVLGIAHMGEGWARITGREPRVTLDGARLSRKRMFFSTARIEQELGYHARPAREAIADAIEWFGDHGYLS